MGAAIVPQQSPLGGQATPLHSDNQPKPHYLLSAIKEQPHIVLCLNYFILIPTMIALMLFLELSEKIE